MKKLFNKPSIYLDSSSDDGDNPLVARLSVGGKNREFLFFGTLTSRQDDRVQVEVSADGTIYTTVCNGSVGECWVSLLDRPMQCDEKSELALKCYASELSSLEDRKATLGLYADDGTIIAKFTGMIRGVDVSIKYTDSGIMLFLTTLKLLGSWRS